MYTFVTRLCTWLNCVHDSIAYMTRLRTWLDCVRNSIAYVTRLRTWLDCVRESIAYIYVFRTVTSCPWDLILLMMCFYEAWKLADLKVFLVYCYRMLHEMSHALIAWKLSSKYQLAWEQIVNTAERKRILGYKLALLQDLTAFSNILCFWSYM